MYFQLEGLSRTVINENNSLTFWKPKPFYSTDSTVTVPLTDLYCRFCSYGYGIYHHFQQYWLAAGQWFSPGTPVFSTNTTDRHDITEIVLKVTVSTINTHTYGECQLYWWRKYRCQTIINTATNLSNSYSNDIPITHIIWIFDWHATINSRAQQIGYLRFY